MFRKVAIKKLTASDLTFFEWHFKNRKVGGNQKAINLNSDIFINKMYPILPEIALTMNGKFPIDLRIFGPGFHGLHNLQRKVVKFGTYKNWRLNGEFVYNHDSQVSRYNRLRPGDYLII